MTRCYATRSYFWCCYALRACFCLASQTAPSLPPGYPARAGRIHLERFPLRIAGEFIQQEIDFLLLANAAATSTPDQNMEITL